MPSRRHSPFDAGATEQVLLEMRLTFVRESIDVIVPANSPTESLQPVAVSDVLTGAKMDVQPLAGDDFQSLSDGLAQRRARPGWPAAHKGGRADDRRAAGEQREPERPVHRRLRSRVAERRRGIGRSAGESVRRGIRTVLDQRHAGAHQARHQRVAVKPGNLMPGFGKGAGFIDKFEPRLSVSGPLKRNRLLLGQYLQYRFARTPVDEPSGQPDTRASTASIPLRGSTRCCRRVTR